MSKAKSKSRKGAVNEYYSYLTIFTSRRIALGILAVVHFLALAFFLRGEMTAGTPWGVMAMPVLSFGLLWLLFPSTEQWEYQPWQTATQKQERLFLN